MAKHQDISGQKFGRLTALKFIGDGKWLCRCECGGFSRPSISALRKGNSTTCGCGVRAATFKHGMSKTAIHQAWRVMRDRCNNPNSKSYHNYGGRGIKVCERWESFSNFLSDMGVRPEGCDIDRIDNDKGYSPENCRWVTRSQNLRNTRIARMLTYKGEMLSEHVWAERYGLDHQTLKCRLKAGWDVELALNGKPYATLYKKSKEP